MRGLHPLPRRRLRGLYGVHCHRRVDSAPARLLTCGSSPGAELRIVLATAAHAQQMRRAFAYLGIEAGLLREHVDASVLAPLGIGQLRNLGHCVLQLPQLAGLARRRRRLLAGPSAGVAPGLSVGAISPPMSSGDDMLVSPPRAVIRSSPNTARRRP